MKLPRGEVRALSKTWSIFKDFIMLTTLHNVLYFPVAAETLGGLHAVAVEQVKKLGAALARQTGQEEGEAKRHLFQRLSLHLMRGNAALLVNRSPDFPAPEVDGRV